MSKQMLAPGYEAQIEQSEANALLAHIQSDLFKTNAEIQARNTAYMIQKFDQTANQQLGSATYQLARAGNLSRNKAGDFFTIDELGIKIDTSLIDPRTAITDQIQETQIDIARIKADLGMNLDDDEAALLEGYTAETGVEGRTGSAEAQAAAIQAEIDTLGVVEDPGETPVIGDFQREVEDEAAYQAALSRHAADKPRVADLCKSDSGDIYNDGAGDMYDPTTGEIVNDSDKPLSDSGTTDSGSDGKDSKSPAEPEPEEDLSNPASNDRAGGR